MIDGPELVRFEDRGLSRRVRYEIFSSNQPDLRIWMGYEPYKLCQGQDGALAHSMAPKNLTSSSSVAMLKEPGCCRAMCKTL